MIKDLALVSLYFEYPENQLPLIYSNAVKYLGEENVYIARFDGVPRESSYYEKLYRYKLFYLLPYIEEHILGKYEYMLFVDAKDTNFYRDPSTLIEDFKSFNKSIVFCGERELWPTTNLTHLYSTKERTGPFAYLNSGAYIGYTAKIVEHLQNIVKEDYKERIEDQSTWTIEYLLNDDIEIDSEGKLFFSTHTTKSYTFEDSTGKIVLTGINPYIIHDNGPYGEDTLKFAHLL